MSTSNPITTTEDHRAWLTRMVALGRLIGLPPYRPPGEEFAQRPERYARRLIEEPDRDQDPRRKAAAFRAWVESQPRPHPWTARSHIDLDAHTFESLRDRREIHQALETIAHPDGSGPMFEATPALSAEARAELRRRRLARRSDRIARHIAETGSILLFVILTLTTMAFVGVASLPRQANPASWRQGGVVMAALVVTGIVAVPFASWAFKVLKLTRRTRIAPKKPRPGDDWTAP